MRRFFINPDNLEGSTALILGQEAHHLAHVLRLQVNEQICLLDGNGHSYVARIDRIASDRVVTSILSTAEAAEIDTVSLHLGTALLKGKKTDRVMRQATELGIDGLHPFVSRYCVNRPASHRQSGRLQRWQRIVHEACKQCGRSTIPTCYDVLDFEALLADANHFDLKLIFWEGETTSSLTTIIGRHGRIDSVLMLVGPEGGFSHEEIRLAGVAGFLPVSLGDQIMRAETACLAATTVVQFLLGNLGEPRGQLDPGPRNGDAA